MLKYGHIIPLYAANLKGINRLNLKESRVYIQAASLKLYENGFTWYKKCLSEMLNGIIMN